MIQIENDSLSVEILEKGTELNRIYSKEFDIDYLWSGDSKWWSGKSPLLFPIIGGSKGIKVDGKIYSIPKHGFGKNLMFKGEKLSAETCEFSYTYDEETLKCYPYKFKLIVRYELNQNKLDITYRIVNLDDKDIYYSIGGHPGFSLNLVEGDLPKDYFLEFSEDEKLISKYKIRKDTFVEHLNKEVGRKVIGNLEEKFIDDALIFQNLKSTSVKLLSKKHSHGLELDFHEFEYLGLWAKVGAPYVCIEPWTGINDFSEFNGEFAEKQGIKKLKEKEDKSFTYSVSFF